jgi:hypothetical protein
VKPLVELRCDTRGCGRLLATIHDNDPSGQLAITTPYHHIGGLDWSHSSTAVLDWSTIYEIPVCPQHHRGPTPWAARGRWRGWHGVTRSDRGGFVIMTATRVPATALRQAVGRAERNRSLGRGRLPVIEPVHPAAMHSN